MNARGGRRDTPGKVLKDRRSPRRTRSYGDQCIERAFFIFQPSPHGRAGTYARHAATTPRPVTLNRRPVRSGERASVARVARRGLTPAAEARSPRPRNPRRRQLCGSSVVHEPRVRRDGPSDEDAPREVRVFRLRPSPRELERVAPPRGALGASGPARQERNATSANARVASRERRVVVAARRRGAPRRVRARVSERADELGDARDREFGFDGGRARRVLDVDVVFEVVFVGVGSRRCASSSTRCASCSASCAFVQSSVTRLGGA